MGATATPEIQNISKNDLTYIAVTRALNAMGAQFYELGCLHNDRMDLRQNLSRDDVIAAIPNLRAHQRTTNTHVYIRQQAPSHLTVVDDLTVAAVGRMRQDGFYPALVVHTSPGNYQAWIKHSAPLDQEIQRRVSRDLAKRYDGDLNAAGERRFGRLPGFRNMKPEHKRGVAVPEFDDWRQRNFHRNLDGQWLDREKRVYTDEQLHRLHDALVPRGYYPFVLVSESTGRLAERSPQLIAAAGADLAAAQVAQRQEQARLREYLARTPERVGHAKTIDRFHNDPRYGGDLSRADLAYAIHAAGRGMGDSDISAQIGKRDLSHHGHVCVQQAYIKRTIEKARHELSMQVGQGMSL